MQRYRFDDNFTCDFFQEKQNLLSLTVGEVTYKVTFAKLRLVPNIQFLNEQIYLLQKYM